ncbi:hypothetical protein [Microtetraspora sp. NBRC 16547]|uniref:hypothetical protein n=1 Tax=Microtetraspora sp. NBRC 16547 TaxID=3030993 RepID=UPI0024A48A50|nr:hypothetical protein [Microtetraspora sp. NBRC 16547]GLX01241.1 hypothetical protein Misp02_53270 [Microtetraspora sp. NBRC 16547]
MDSRRGVSREELKQGAVVLLAVLLVLGLVTAWSVLIPGVMDWDNIMVAVIGSLRLTGPVAAAFAAWIAARRRRAGRRRTLTTWQAVRPPLAILMVVVGSFAATMTVLTVRALLTGEGNGLRAGGVALGAAGLALYVVAGWVAGWLAPVAVAPLIAGFGTYALFTWVASGAPWADRLTPAGREPYDAFRMMPLGTFTAQALWLVGISVALLLGWAAFVTRQALALAAAMIALLAAGTGVARLLSEPQAVAVSENFAYSCQEWPIVVCVHPGMRGGLGELGSTFTTIAARLAGTPAAFNRVEQRSRSDADKVAKGVVPIYVDDLDAGYAARAASEFVEQLARPCPGSPADGYRAIVIAWLRDEPLPSGPLAEHRRAATWFAHLTETQRRDWLRMFYTDFATCRLQSRYFGGDVRRDAPAAPSYPMNPPFGRETPDAPAETDGSPLVTPR